MTALFLWVGTGLALCLGRDRTIRTNKHLHRVGLLHAGISAGAFERGTKAAGSIGCPARFAGRPCRVTCWTPWDGSLALPPFGQLVVRCPEGLVSPTSAPTLFPFQAVAVRVCSHVPEVDNCRDYLRHFSTDW